VDAYNEWGLKSLTANPWGNRRNPSLWDMLFHKAHGTLYLASLKSLIRPGWIASEWGESEKKRKAEYYRLTTAGRRRLQTETEKWSRTADVMAGILETNPEEI